MCRIFTAYGSFAAFAIIRPKWKTDALMIAHAKGIIQGESAGKSSGGVDKPAPSLYNKQVGHKPKRRLYP